MIELLDRSHRVVDARHHARQHAHIGDVIGGEAFHSVHRAVQLGLDKIDRPIVLQINQERRSADLDDARGLSKAEWS
ncbi:hypothetical protein ACFQY5_41560 [Paeniroseomonas aquatica]|uniref:hypothetical protein n=1 Tax=Paeniroseomonas aquatica TaxID=373043 RepID=UPI00360EEB9E